MAMALKATDEMIVLLERKPPSFRPDTSRRGHDADPGILRGGSAGIGSADRLAGASKAQNHAKSVRVSRSHHDDVLQRVGRILAELPRGYHLKAEYRFYM